MDKTRLDRLHDELMKAKKKRDDWDGRVKELERKYREAENTFIHDMVHAASLTPEQLAELIRKASVSLPYTTESREGETGADGGEDKMEPEATEPGTESAVAEKAEPVPDPAGAEKTESRTDLTGTAKPEPVKNTTGYEKTETGTNSAGYEMAKPGTYAAMPGKTEPETNAHTGRPKTWPLFSERRTNEKK